MTARGKARSGPPGIKEKRMYVEGCHATVFILETGSLTTCPGWTRRCMQTYLEKCHKCRCGLANLHLALVADPTHPLLSTHEHEIQVGAWYPIRQLVFRTPRPARRRWERGKGQRSRAVVKPAPLVDIHYNYTQLKELIAALDTPGLPATDHKQAPPPHNRMWDEMASQLHTLLDNPPWSPEENTIVDVHWFFGEEPAPSPSTAASLSGALLRLRMWHNAYLQIVVCDTTNDRDSSEEWFDVAEARVCTADTWTDGLADIWRGSLHFTERRMTMKQACRKTVVFPGFSLSLHTPNDDVTKTPPLADDVINTAADDVTKTAPPLADDVYVTSTAPPLADDVTSTALPLADDVTNKAPPLGDDVTNTAPPLADDVTNKAPPLSDDVTNTAPPLADDVTSTALPLADDVTNKAPPLGDDVITESNDVIKSSTTLLRDVGLPKESATPTHLEVVQILDTSTLPFFWLSPLRCTLSLNNKGHADSALLLPELFKCKGTGLLVRLCYAEQDRKSRSQHKTTADWNKYLQSVDENDLCNSSPSPLASYECGPLLAVFQLNNGEMSCDAWFLWKPEAINSAPFLRLQEIRQDSTSDRSTAASIEQLTLRLPLITITDDQQTAIDGEFVLDDLSSSPPSEEQDLHTRPASHTDQELSSSEIPEMKALLTYEWIQRKLVRRLTTPDLMFGQMVAPPPSSTAKACLNADDVLECFHETGSPATSELSPIANDVSDVAKIRDPRASGDGVPSFENIANTTPGSKRRYHGVNYCLQPEDSMMDSRLTRIQQRYLLSERAGNCSSSNTPEVKLEQRRRRRLRKTGTPSCDNKKEETTKSEVGGLSCVGKGKGKAVERLELTVRGEEEKEQEVGGGKRSEMVASDGAVDDVEQARDKRGEQELLISVTLSEPTTATPTSSSGLSGVKLSKSPVVKLHRIQTPPSSRPASLLSRLKEKHTTTPGTEEGEHTHIEPTAEKDRLELTVNDGGTSGTDTAREVTVSHVKCLPAGSKLRRSPRKKLELTLNDVAHASGVEQGSPEGDTKLRRSPRKNKWVTGGKSGTSKGENLSSHKGKSYKKKLEQIIVVALKKKGMKRDHVCFRKCYNRLFNLSKSFLKDLRSSTALVREMYRVVEFNVSQVIDFELRQANTSL